MKAPFILFSLLVMFMDINAQERGFMIRTSQLFTNNAKEEVFPDSPLVIVPTELDDYSHYGLDVSYYRKTKNYKWVLRVGYDEVSSKGSLLLARSFGYINSKENRVRRTVRLGSGIYYPTALKDERLDLDFTLMGMFEYKFEHSTKFESDAFDEKDNYLQGYKVAYEYPDSWKIRLESGLAFYYYFFRGLGIGGEISPYLYFERLKGSQFDSLQFFDENRSIAESDSSEHKERRNNFGLSVYYAFGINFKF